MRVLFVTNRYPTDQTPGSSPAIQQQRRSLQQLGHEVDVLLIESETSNRKWWAYLKGALRVFRYCQIRGKYDVVHAHFGSYCSVAARSQVRCPVVVTFRGSDVLTKRQRPVSRLVARLIDKRIVMTDHMRQVLGMDAEVLPYGIDLEVFKPQDQKGARRELGLPEAVPIVLFPYDPNRGWKRFDFAEAAVDIVKRSFPEVQLLAVHGKTPDMFAKYLNASDVMVLTSMPKREGSPSAVREALACNLPVVSVDSGDVVDVISKVEGCYVADHSVDDIAEKLRRVLEKRQRVDGWEAANRISLSSTASRIEKIYQELVGADTGRPESAGKRPIVEQAHAGSKSREAA